MCLRFSIIFFKLWTSLVTLVVFGLFWFSCSQKVLNNWMQTFYFVHTWWRLLQKRIMSTKLDFYVFLTITVEWYFLFFILLLYNDAKKSTYINKKNLQLYSSGYFNIWSLFPKIIFAKRSYNEGCSCQYLALFVRCQQTYIWVGINMW